MKYLEFTIWPYANTRRTAYTLKDVTKAILDAGLTPTRSGWLVKTICHTIQERKILEQNLKRAHRNIPYIVEVKEIQS